MRVNAITVKPFKNQRLDHCKRERAPCFYGPKVPRGPNLRGKILLPSQRLWARVRCNHFLKEYNGGCIRVRGRLLANPKSGVCMCDKCPPAVRSMLAGKEETAAAEKKHKAQLLQASAAADAWGLPARPVQRTIKGSLSRASKDELHVLVADL